MRAPTKLAAWLVAALAVALVGHEGRRYTPYSDPVGIRTVCDGITGPDVIEGKTYTDAECDALSAKFIEAKWSELDACIDAALSPNEQGAMTHLAYNVGARAICSSSIPAKFERGDHAGACATISDFYRATDFRSPPDPATGKRKRLDCRVRSNGCYGLVKRREFERAWCEGKLTFGTPQ